MTRRAQGAGSVYLRQDGRYAASASFEGKRITKYGKTKKEAWDNLQTALDDLKQGRVVIGPKQTVKQYLEHWLENSRRLRVEPTTLANYRVLLRVHLLPAFGHLQLSQLTREQVQSFYVEKLDSGLAPSTIRNIHDLFVSALKDAVADEILVRNVCEYVTVPKQKQRKPHVLNVEQCKRLIAAARGRRLWFLILMAITTGARVGELLALHWEDIDLNNLRVHIHRSVCFIKGKGLVEKEPKTKQGARRVILTQVVIGAISEQKEFIEKVHLNGDAQWEDLDLVFPNKQGRYIRNARVLKEFRMILVDAGLPAAMHFHDLRHSAATLLFAAGVNPKVVSEALGHSSIGITLGLYGDVTPDMQQETGRVMDRLFE
ncbi:MAG: site-specific integrase [Ktedonobacteraceae bacterium]